MVRRERQRPHTRVRVKHLLTMKPSARKRTIRFAQQVIDLPVVRTRLTRITFKPHVSRADEIVAVPRNDEQRPAIAHRLNINRTLRRPLKRHHHHMPSPPQLTEYCFSPPPRRRPARGSSTSCPARSQPTAQRR